MNASEIQVEVNEMPETHVAYLRHTGPYAGDSALFGRLFGQLCAWAGPRGLLRPDQSQFLTIYHDNPQITEEEKLRMSVCLSVPADTAVDGEIGKTAIPAGQYAVGHFEISDQEYGEAWNAVCGTWLPESGYQPDDRPCFEIYRNNPEEHPEKKHIVDICVPVKPL